MARSYLADNGTLTIRLVCSTLSLARSSFYAAKHAKNKNDLLDKQVWNRILKVWDKFPGWGYRKLAPKLKENGKRIRRVLKNYRRLSEAKKQTFNKAIDKTRKYPNLIKKITQDLMANPTKLKRKNWILRDGKNKYRKVIDPTRPYQLWAGDWKELKLPLLGVTFYIFIIIDCDTRQIMGYSLSLVKDGKTSLKASQMAVSKALKDPLFKPRALIMHTDQGSAYLSTIYETYWRKLGAKLSSADKGKPTQNPYAEAFISLLVRYCLNQYELLTVSDVKQAVKRFIRLYNSEWVHGEIGYISPDQKLKQYQSYLTN